MQLDLPRLSIVEDVSGVRFLTDPALESACGVSIGFTERAGGLSAPPYGSLNLGRFAGEGEDAALANIHRLMDAVGAADMVLINPKQVHGTHIVTASDDAPDAIASVQREAEAGADGVVASVPDAFALLCFADCVPLIMVAPTGDFAVAHSGWRGTHGRIASKALASLASAVVRGGAYGSTQEAAASCNTYIGPYIHQECFQVGEDTRSLFIEEFGESVVDASGNVDLGAAIRADLLAVGASEDRIVDAGLCTVCDVERFFSYRAEEGTCGRHGAFAFRRRG